MHFGEIAAIKRRQVEFERKGSRGWKRELTQCFYFRFFIFLTHACDFYFISETNEPIRSATKRSSSSFSTRENDKTAEHLCVVVAVVVVDARPRARLRFASSRQCPDRCGVDFASLTGERTTQRGENRRDIAVAPFDDLYRTVTGQARTYAMNMKRTMTRALTHRAEAMLSSNSAREILHEVRDGGLPERPVIDLGSTGASSSDDAWKND